MSPRQPRPEPLPEIPLSPPPAHEPRPAEIPERHEPLHEPGREPPPQPGPPPELEPPVQGATHFVAADCRDQLMSAQDRAGSPGAWR
jgi:hypothetical protein